MIWVSLYVFQYLIKIGSIFMNRLSDRIKSFNYGYIERKNKPSGLKMYENSKYVGLNTIQSLCVLHNTPLIFGDMGQ